MANYSSSKGGNSGTRPGTQSKQGKQMTHAHTGKHHPLKAGPKMGSARASVPVQKGVKGC